MKIPYFESIGLDKPRPEAQTIKRKNVFVILENKSNNKICLLDWKKFGWKSFIVGGVEAGETYVDGAKRETIEETGYNDFGEIKLLPFEFHNNFYAKHKSVNRYSIEKYVIISLNSLNNIGVNESEVINHDFIWVNKEEVSGIINLDNNKYAWVLFITGKENDENFLKTLKNFQKFI